MQIDVLHSLISDSKCTRGCEQSAFTLYADTICRLTGEHAPAALAMAGSLALQAMMLGLPRASPADSDIFWRVRVESL